MRTSELKREETQKHRNTDTPTYPGLHLFLTGSKATYLNVLLFSFERENMQLICVLRF
jgi:hypothetical protein